MSLIIGDRLVIKRNGVILTPDIGESYQEFEVVETPNFLAIWVKDKDGFWTTLAGHDIKVKDIV